MVCPCYVHFGTQNCHVERRIRRSVVDRRSLCRPFAHFAALLSTVEPALMTGGPATSTKSVTGSLSDEIQRINGDLRAARECWVPVPSTTIDELMTAYGGGAPLAHSPDCLGSGDQQGSATSSPKLVYIKCKPEPTGHEILACYFTPTIIIDALDQTRTYYHTVWAPGRSLACGTSAT